MFEEYLPKELVSKVLRRGKWTPEEEVYAECIIRDFENGTLDAEEGTTLRAYMSKVLNCEPMRITKKFTKKCFIGKRSFIALERNPENVTLIQSSRDSLKLLRHKWVRKLILIEKLNTRRFSLCKDGTVTTGNEDQSCGTEDSKNYASVSQNDTADESLATRFGLRAEFPDELLRERLLPFVNSAGELDFIIIWLKTLFYVLSEHVLSVEDIEHSIFVGSISIPGLFSIVQSKCLCDQIRLIDVERKIEQYLQRHQSLALRAGISDSSVPHTHSHPLPHTSAVRLPPSSSTGSPSVDPRKGKVPRPLKEEKPVSNMVTHDEKRRKVGNEDITTQFPSRSVPKQVSPSVLGVAGVLPNGLPNGFANGLAAWNPQGSGIPQSVVPSNLLPMQRDYMNSFANVPAHLMPGTNYQYPDPMSALLLSHQLQGPPRPPFAGADLLHMLSTPGQPVVDHHPNRVSYPGPIPTSQNNFTGVPAPSDQSVDALLRQYSSALNSVLANVLVGNRMNGMGLPSTALPQGSSTRESGISPYLLNTAAANANSSSNSSSATRPPSSEQRLGGNPAFRAPPWQDK